MISKEIAQRFMMKSPVILHSLLFSAGILACVAPSQAAVVADFSGGNGNASADQYTGTAGSGWLGGWGTTGTAPTTTVASATPINGSGNYLSVSTATNADNAVGRRFDGTAAGVNTALPTTITFDLRIDTLTGWASNTDYLTVHSNNAAAGATYNVGVQSTFIIRAYGATPGSGKAGNQWLFYNGASDGGGFNVANFQDSGMTLTAGTTYSFAITNNPGTKSYDVSIFDGTNTVSASNLGWRDDEASNSIAFNQRVSAASGDQIQYSVDNIMIVPEPGAIALLSLTGLAMLRRRRVV